VDNLLDFKSRPKNKFVKSPTHANAQNTLSFFTDTHADPKKNERVFSSPPKKGKRQKDKQPSKRGLFVMFEIRNFRK
jgi:hypothetical protein